MGKRLITDGVKSLRKRQTLGSQRRQTTVPQLKEEVRVWMLLRSEQKVNGVLLAGLYLVCVNGHSEFSNCVKCQKHSGVQNTYMPCPHAAYMPKGKTENM